MRTDRHYPKEMPYSALAGLLVALLGGCSTSSGFLTGGTEATSWCKFYCFGGQSAVRATGGGFGGGETMGAMESVGLVCHGDQSDAVKLALVKAGCQADASE